MGIINTIKNVITDPFRPVLSDRQILKYNSRGLLIEGKLTPEQLQPNSVDLHLANTWKTLKPSVFINHTFCIDPHAGIEYDEGVFSRESISYGAQSHKVNTGWYMLQPHQFVLMASQEVLNIPNGILSFVQGRSSVARMAIQTEQAGLIDAGFRGTITFEVYNQSDHPICLYEGMRIAQVYFFKAQYADQIYGADKGSKYHGQIEATGSSISNDPELKSVVNRDSGILLPDEIREEIAEKQKRATQSSDINYKDYAIW